MEVGHARPHPTLSPRFFFSIMVGFSWLERVPSAKCAQNYARFPRTVPHKIYVWFSFPLSLFSSLCSLQTPSASMSPGLRRSKRKRTAPGRFADQQQSLTPPPMRTGNGSGFTFGANTPSSSSSSSRSRPMPRRGDREADLARWKRLASDISERLKRRRFSPQTFLN